jgi:hypothetical protein
MSTRWTSEDIKAKGLKVSGEKPSAVPTSTGQERHRALGRLKSGVMNKTETKYSQRLEALKTAGNVLWWRFGVINLKLADGCFYRTDFAVLLSSSQFEIHETKGFLTDDALVKLKVAAELFPFAFRMFTFKKGEWIEREF